MKKRVDVLIKGGLLFDGCLTEPEVMDIAVTGDTITARGSIPGREARMVIDASGLAVAPGFIDVHAHSDFTLLADPRAEGKISQGVTTEINGNCGMSAGPLYHQAYERRQADLEGLGIRDRWNSLGEYFALIGKRGIALNLATLAGHGNIRGSVMGYEDRRPTADELSGMLFLLRQAIDAGAIGMSTGLIYPPGVYSNTEELIEFARVLKEQGLIYTSHMRSEADWLIESVREVIRIGREGGGRVHISHIKTAGERNWGKADEVIGLIEQARSSGVLLTCDRYPYTASSTDLDSLLPAWAYEGGNEEELKRLRDPVDRERICRELESVAGKSDYWKTVIISSVGTEKNVWMEGRTISDISASMGLSEVDVLFRVLTEERLRVGAIFLSMSEINLKKFLSLPYCMIGSDSSSRSFDGPTRQGKPHPRTFGTFPRFLGRYVCGDGIMGLSEAIYQSTALAAQTFGLRRRGLIREGMFADIVVFDPETIIDQATFENPYQRSSGIRHVLVNGVAVINEGEFCGAFPGRVLRRGDAGDITA